MSTSLYDWGGGGMSSHGIFRQWANVRVSLCPLIILTKSGISRLYVVSVAQQASLCLSWSETPKTGFLVTRVTYIVSWYWLIAHSKQWSVWTYATDGGSSHHDTRHVALISNRDTRQTLPIQTTLPCLICGTIVPPYFYLRSIVFDAYLFDDTYLSRDMTKPTKWVCAQRRLRSAWASAQTGQRLRCALNG